MNFYKDFLEKLIIFNVKGGRMKVGTYHIILTSLILVQVGDENKKQLV